MNYEDIKVGDEFVCWEPGFSRRSQVVTITKTLPKGGFRLSNGRMFKDRIPFWLNPLTPELRASMALVKKREKAVYALFRMNRAREKLPESVLDKILEAESEWQKIEQAGKAEGRQG